MTYRAREYAIIALALTVFTSSSAYCKSEKEVLLNNEGVKALGRREFTVAINKFKSALATNPRYALARENLGVACNNYALALRRTPKEGIKFVHSALIVDSDNKATQENLDSFVQMLGKDPKSFDDRVELGDTAQTSGDFAGALIEYEAALKIKDNLDVRKKLALVVVPDEWKEIIENKDQDDTDDSMQRSVSDKTVDFGPYMAALQRKIKRNWTPPHGKEKRRAKAVFKVGKTGKLSDLKITATTGSDSADKAALNAVEQSAPFEALPEGSPEAVEIEFTFDYNMNAGAVKEVDKSTEQQLAADLAKAEKSGNKSSIARAEIALAEEYYEQEKNAEAVPHYKRGIELLQKEKAAAIVIAEPIMSLGYTYYNLQDFDKALASFREAVTILKKTNTPKQLSDALAYEAHCLSEKQDYENSTSVYTASLLECAKGYGETSMEFGLAKHYLAKSLYAEEKYSEALSQSEGAYKLFDGQYRESPDFPEITRILANCYWSEKKYAKALELYKSVLASKENSVQANDSELGDRVKDVADCYYELDKKVEALPFYERALAIHSEQEQPNTAAINEERDRINEISAREDARMAKEKARISTQERTVLIERWLPWAFLGVVVGLLLVFIFDRKNRESNADNNPFS